MNMVSPRIRLYLILRPIGLALRGPNDESQPAQRYRKTGDAKISPEAHFANLFA
jgi:hypothetical protein